MKMYVSNVEIKCSTEIYICPTTCWIFLLKVDEGAEIYFY